MDATAWKDRGNEHFKAKEYTDAIEAFSNAIALDGNNHVLYSNRSASFASLFEYESAFDDARRCVELNPNWAKGYIRLGAAQHGLKQLDEAEASYRKGLAIEPSNESLQQSLAALQEDRARAAAPAPEARQNPFAKVFGPDTVNRVRANPRLAPYLAQPDYLQILTLLSSNPSMVQGFMQDPRIMNTMLELSGIDTSSMGRAADAERGAPRPQQQQQQPQREEAPKPAAPKPAAPSSASEAAASPALRLKEEGNALYKKRDFDGALAKYQAAFDLEPKNTTFLLNMTAVQFEQGNYQVCIEECEKATAHGQENGAEYTVLAKLMARKASCLQKLGKHEEAIELFNKSLLEHRNAETLAKLDACKQEKKKRDEEAYYDEALSLKAKEEGNAFFKTDNYPEAVKCYDEAQKRNPKDHTVYSNRAAALLKLRAYEDAIRDCDRCLAIKPDFVKAITRKAHAYFWTKQYHRALTEYDLALKSDPAFQEAVDGKERTMMKIQEMMHGEGDEEAAQRAMQDPEIQQILSDSYMQMVLSEMQKDPKKINDYLKDPGISAKINKLIIAGVLRVGNGPANAGGQRGQQRR